MDNTVSFIPLGGVGDVTRNMYLYEYKDEILIVDCGLGFADETMLGVDLLLPDISYLLSTKKKIVGMVLTHGHEDHIGALPFILPQLPKIPIFATPLTAAFANEKLQELQVSNTVTSVQFADSKRNIGSFSIEFIRVTHSVPDTSHIFIRTPVGNFYHGSDFKFDPTPVDEKPSNLARIREVAKEGIIALSSDCLGAERKGQTPSEVTLMTGFEREMKQCRGKCIVTTYASNVSRLNQAIVVAHKYGRKVCFIGRSLIKAKDIAQKLGYMIIPPGMEVGIESLKRMKDSQLLLLVAGSQGQENSAMSRIVSGEHKEVKLNSDDVVIFSSDPIPGNEVMVYEVIDTIAKKGARVVYSDISDEFHVSGHGRIDELTELIKLTKPKKIIPIGGNYRHMVAYRDMAEKLGFQKNDILLLEDGQEVMFTKEKAALGKQIDIKNVYVDEISGEELEHFVLRDRKKLSESGIVVILSEVDSATGELVGRPDIIARGFTGFDDKRSKEKLFQQIQKVLRGRKGRVTNWVYIRNLIGELTEKFLFREFRRRPLVLPVVIEV